MGQRHCGSTALVVGTAVMAASTGILFPVIAYWTSIISTGRGLAFGRQMAAANLGQMLGSASIGVLSNTHSTAEVSFLPAGIGAHVAAMLSVMMRNKLQGTSRRVFPDS